MIIGFSGKKMSGKNTCANYINGIVLKQRGCIQDFRLLDNGDLNVLTDYGDGTTDWGILDIYRKDAEFTHAAENTIWPYVKNYSFADSLKEVAVKLFELKPESVYGTDEQKNAPTHLLWENMPGIITNQHTWDDISVVGNVHDNLLYHEPGFMTGREFLQFLGTEIGRRMYDPIWINSTINKIKEEQTGVALVTDVRFPNEVEAIKRAGGIIIRLTRKIFDDLHLSENILNQDAFDWDNFDFILDNQDLSIEESCKTLRNYINSF